MASKTAPPNGNGALRRTLPEDAQEQKLAVAPRRRKPQPKTPEDEGLMATLCTLICNHQIGMFAWQTIPPMGLL